MLKKRFSNHLFPGLFLLLLSAQAQDGVIRDPVDGYTFQYAEGPTFAVTNEQQRVALDRINARIQIEKDTPESEKRRESDGEFKNSYTLFHPAGEGGREILGTVLLFHGFSNRPEQMSKLAAYLFHSGFNVYNVFLSQHYKAPGSRFWPKLLYRLDVLHNIHNNDMDPQFAGKVLGIYERQDPVEFASVFETGIRDEGGQAYDGWVADAKDRLAQLDSLPGPIYVIGLSLGSSLALRLGAEDGGKRIKGIVAHAPYLQENNPDRRNQIKLFGPVGMQNIILNGQEISAASAANQQLLGDSLFLEANLQRLAQVPTFLVGTESDKSADTGRSYGLHAKLVERAQGNVTHTWFTYNRDAAVGHAMTDPRDYPEPAIGADQGGGRNYRYKALYQETCAFLLKGRVDQNNLYQFGQNPNLPGVRFIFENY